MSEKIPPFLLTRTDVKIVYWHRAGWKWKMSEPLPARIPTWAPRLKQRLVWRLYESDARGLHDEELLAEAGWGLYSRCKSFIEANAAVNGRAGCPGCGAIILHHGQPEEILRCPACGWTAAWKVYFQTIQRKQLSGAAPVIALFQDFVDRFPKAGSAQEKMLLIDALIHGWHWNARYGNTRAAAANLIEGSYHQVVDFLDRLSYGPKSTPGARQQWQKWREEVNRTADLWKDERLRRRPHEG